MITLNLFNEPIQDASAIVEISDSDKAIMRHSIKILLFYNNQTWKEKSGAPNLDVIMGFYDGAEPFLSIYFFTQIKQYFK